MPKSSSILTCSGAYWARWSAGWGAFLALIVLIPEGHSQPTMARVRSSEMRAHDTLVAKLEAVRASNAGAIAIRMTSFDLSEHTGRDFGDRDSSEIGAR